jgi:hypothetical protein
MAVVESSLPMKVFLSDIPRDVVFPERPELFYAMGGDQVPPLRIFPYGFPLE